ncbi:hypothetical protein Lser_V15G34880 [Lactuca serriola]
MKAARAFVQTNNLDKEMDECIEKLKGLEWRNSDPKYITDLMLFAENVGHNERFRVVKERFHHSIQTIHQCFHEVLKTMMCFAREIIVPTSSNTTRNTSERHRRLKNIFPGALCALDGTLVHAVVPVDEQTRYRGRAGWEGIAHDSKVLKEVLFNPTFGFPFPPPDKYYLCDAAYTNTRGFMAPTAILGEISSFKTYGSLSFSSAKRHSHCGGSEGQNIQNIEWGSETIEYMTTLRDQIATQLLSNGSR